VAGLRPFFTYYGGKWRAAPHYPKPAHDLIIEPFAGSAGYALRYHERRVILNEKNPRLAAMWRFIVKATADDFRNLPDLPAGATVDDLPVHQEGRDLIGYWLNKGTTHPSKTASAWMRSGIRPKSYWGPEIRQRLVAQAGAIAHWIIAEGDYADLAPSIATWFVDPPYQGAGTLYTESARSIDFVHLGSWCRTLPGQAIVCEGPNASWLPFVPFRTIKSSEGRYGKGQSIEGIWPGLLHMPRPLLDPRACTP